jgi:hemerythrin superfamily protein
MVESVSNMFGAGTDGTQQNAIELLKTDHDKVEALFARVKKNEDGNNSDVFRQIKQELDVHAHIEEQVFYPHCLQYGDEELQKIVREGLEEHAQVKILLPEIAALSGDSEDFKAKLKVLIEDVEHHVEEEEGEMFSLVEDQFDEEMLIRLGSLLDAEKVRIGGSAARSASGNQ